MIIRTKRITKYIVHDYYDHPLSGICEYQGKWYYFSCIWDKWNSYCNYLLFKMYELPIGMMLYYRHNNRVWNKTMGNSWDHTLVTRRKGNEVTSDLDYYAWSKARNSCWHGKDPRKFGKLYGYTRIYGRNIRDIRVFFKGKHPISGKQGAIWHEISNTIDRTMDEKLKEDWTSAEFNKIYAAVPARIMRIHDNLVHN